MAEESRDDGGNPVGTATTGPRNVEAFFAEYVDLSAVGQWTEVFPYRIEPDSIRTYAAATNDLANPRHASGEIAPPLYAVVVSRAAVVRALALAMPRGNPPGMQRLHGEHDIHFGRPLLPHALVSSKASLIGVHVKRSGTVLTFRIVTWDAHGVLVTEQYMTSFVPGLGGGQSMGVEAPNFRLPHGLTSVEPLDRVTYRTEADQTFRYAPASGDMSRLHLDADYAKSVGAPGIILHGLCTMAFIGRAVVESCCGADSTRLKRLALRFTHPVFPGEEITTAIWGAGQADGRSVYAFEAMSSSGHTVARFGRAEVVLSSGPTTG